MWLTFQGCNLWFKVNKFGKKEFRWAEKCGNFLFFLKSNPFRLNFNIFYFPHSFLKLLPFQLHILPSELRNSDSKSSTVSSNPRLKKKKIKTQIGKVLHIYHVNDLKNGKYAVRILKMMSVLQLLRKTLSQSDAGD